MLGRTLPVVGLALAALAAPASAATLPAGTYDTQLTGGTLEIGSLPAIPIGAGSTSTVVVPPGTPAEVTLPTDGFVLPPTSSNVPCVPGPTCTVTITPVLVGPVTAGIDPATGAAHANLSAYVTVTGSLGIGGTLNCSIGTAMAPVTLNLTTNPPGQPWDATTSALKLVDNAFALPAPSCTNPTFEALISTVLGATSAGNNLLELGGTISPRPVTAPPPPPPPPPVAPPPPPPPPGTTVPTQIRIDASRLRLDKRGFAPIRVTCVRAPARCAGTLALTARAPRARRTAAAKTLRLGSAKFTIASGKSGVVRVKVSKQGRALLKTRARLRSSLRLTSPALTKPLTKSLTLMPPKKKRR